MLHLQYDQIRYINQEGIEKINVNRHLSQNAFASEFGQRDVSNDVFLKANDMPQGAVFVSRIINKTVMPVSKNHTHPTIQVASPIVDNDGNHYGILIINFSLEHFLDLLVNPLSHEEDEGHLHLLDSEGNHINHSHNSTHHDALADQHLEIWSTLKSSQEDTSFSLENRHAIYKAVVVNEYNSIKQSLGIKLDDSQLKIEEPFLAIISVAEKDKIFIEPLSRLWMEIVLVLLFLSSWLFLIRRNFNLKSKVYKSQYQANKLSKALEQTSDLVTITDDSGNIEYVNASLCETTGYTQKELIGKKPSIFKSGQQSEQDYKEMWDRIKEGNKFQGVIVNRKKDGALYYEGKTISPLFDANQNIEGFISTAKDITNSEIGKMAFYDGLTSVANRELFLDRIKNKLLQHDRENSEFSLLYLDLDNFKAVNDFCGHKVGDDVLQGFAKLCLSLVRKSDTVARIGGDEFAIIICDHNNRMRLEELANKIIIGVNENDSKWVPNTCDINLGVSIGICTIDASEHDLDEDTIIHRADQAMYESKRSGKNRFSFFDFKIEHN